MYEHIIILLGLVMVLVGVLLITLSLLPRKKISKEIISFEKEKKYNREHSKSIGIIVIGPFPIMIRSSSVKLFIILSLIFIIFIFLILMLVISQGLI
ncbi:MAG: TIGR00304 family membrane protein [Sulfolobales archaeon]